MKQLFTLFALLSISAASWSQVVTYNITPSDFNGIELTSGDMCSGPFVIEEAKQMAQGNTWGFSWTSTNSGVPSSITITFYNTITNGGGSHPTTLNGMSAGNVANGSAINCSGGSLMHSWSISPANYNPLGVNTFLVDFAAEATVNQFDNIPATNDVYFTVEVDYTPCTAPTLAGAATDVSCIGDMDGSIDLTVTGGASPYIYSWSPGGETTEDISGLAPGTYTVTVTDMGGCTAVDSFVVAEPAAIDNSVTQDKNVLTANEAGATYQWLDCGDMSPIAGATNQTYTATANGDYAVIITVGSCSDTSACSTVSSVGFGEFNQTEISIFPNPTSNEANLIITDYNGKIEYTVHSLDGKLILSNSGNVQNTLSIPIDLSTQEKGVYLIQVKTEHETFIHRMIKK